MELDANVNRNVGCSRSLKGCAIIVAVAFVAVIALLIYMSRMPVVQDVVTCRMNMTAVGAALNRYHDVHNAYPETLDELKKDYLKNPSVLRCPLDKSPGTEPSYIYHRPKSNSPAKFVVLECCRHRLSKGMPISKMQLRKDGSITLEANPKAPRERSSK